MNSFEIFSKLGMEHVLDLDGLDHVLFIISFILMYTIGQWKQIFQLVTAFTLGHSVTLILVSLGFIVNKFQSIIEFLILMSILLMGLKNYIALFKAKESDTDTNLIKSFLIIFLFGLIHGLGFSSFIKNMLIDENVIVPLLSFNIGIEIAQLFVVLISISIFTLARKIFVNQRRQILLGVNSMIVLYTLYLLFF